VISREPPPQEVVDALVANHRNFLAFLERRVGSRATAEDILQEAFARGIDRFEDIREADSAISWFYRVLRNATIDHFRRKGSADRALESFARELETEAEPSPEIQQVVCRCIGELAKTLKPEYADALSQIEVEGVAVKDYAAKAGISTNNAGVRVFRAREALRKQVARSCGTCAEHGCYDCTCEGSRKK
jgi:RNA polymerase sigma factor (sigma-70 family)